MGPEQMNWTIAFIVAILGTGGLAGLLKHRTDKKKAPLEREATLSAVSQQNVDVALAISKESNEIAREARADARSARAEAAEARAEAATARRTVADVSEQYSNLERAFNALWQWMNNIVTHWSTIREQENPPPLPPEAEYHRHQHRNRTET